MKKIDPNFIIDSLSGNNILWGYLVLFGNSVISIFIPFYPFDFVILFAGYLAGKGRFNWIVVLAIGLLGNMSSSIFFYYLGLRGRKTLLLAEKYTKLSPDKLEKIEGWLGKYGGGIIILSRFFPGMRSAVAVALGISRINFLRVLGFSSLGAFLWIFFLVYIGTALGSNWDKILGFFQRYNLIVTWSSVLALLVLGIFFLTRWIKGRWFD